MSTPLSPGSQSDSSSPIMATASDPPPRRNWTVRAVLAGLIVVGAAWWAIDQGPQEIARWREAAAWEKFFDEDIEGAIEILDEAIAWDPDRADLYMIRAKWRSELGQLEEALADINRSIELDNGQVKHYRMAGNDERNYAVRSEIHQQLGMPEQAVEDWESIAEVEGIGRDPLILNGKAYARAVGNIELERGLKEAETAVDILENLAGMTSTERCGMFLYRAGAGEAAARQFDRTMDAYQERYDEVRQQLADAEAAEPFLGDLLQTSSYERETEREAAALARALANRGHCYAKAGKKNLADADLSKAEELGANLEAAEARLAGTDGDEEQQRKQLGEASAFAAFLDTRGYLYYRLDDNESALKDLNLAVEVEEALNKHQFANPLLPANEYAYYQKQQRKQLAVLRYHRALIHEALGDDQAAHRDLNRVRELGFEPGPELH